MLAYSIACTDDPMQFAAKSVQDQELGCKTFPETANLGNRFNYRRRSGFNILAEGPLIHSELYTLLQSEMTR